MAHKPKRVGFQLDMTPLVDVAFLLLTFFMLTAKFKSDAESEQRFEIKRPMASADTTVLPETGTATVKVAIDDKTNDTVVWYAIANDQLRSTVFTKSGYAEEEATKAQVQVPDSAKLATLVIQSRYADNKMKFVIDADRRISFGKIENVMNTLRGQGATIFNFVTIKAGEAGASTPAESGGG
jgi:biopolymer transport protein ExbD